MVYIFPFFYFQPRYVVIYFSEFLVDSQCRVVYLKHSANPSLLIGIVRLFIVDIIIDILGLSLSFYFNFCLFSLFLHFRCFLLPTVLWDT